MRLASYNVENLFDRAAVMNQKTWADGRAVLTNFAKLNALLGELTYTAATKKKIAELLIALGLGKSDETKFVLLRRNRGKLLARSKGGGIQIVAGGRADWAGSLELVEEPVNEPAMQNTARVLSALKADVIGVIEAENRPSLGAFNDKIIRAVGGTPFRHVMLIDGNDERGIDVGLLTGEKFPIEHMCSHVDDRLPNGQRVFSRDCAQFHLKTAKGNELVVLVNHFKSKGFGTPAASDARRKDQAARARAIMDGLIAQGHANVALIGDLNDTPASAPLAPLLGGGPKDAFSHPQFNDGGFPGTFGSCGPSNKIDYLLLSPALFGKVQKGGVVRDGMWPGIKPKKWNVFPQLTKEEEAASDHAAIWVDLDV
jgi:endonuclease/exonuclease/phosphatase family metal-dependent hydrolase